MPRSWKIYNCLRQYDKRLILRSPGSCRSFGTGVFQGRLCPTKQLALHVTGWQPAGGGQHPLESLIWRANGMLTSCVYYCISCYYWIPFSTISLSLIKVKLRKWLQFKAVSFLFLVLHRQIGIFLCMVAFNIAFRFWSWRKCVTSNVFIDLFVP